jgi:hypothetical protein
VQVCNALGLSRKNLSTAYVILARALKAAMQLTLHDIITLHLADVSDWVPSYQLSKLQTKFGWVKSSGERRARGPPKPVN